MRNLDTIILLNHGANEQKFAEYILNTRKNAQDRLLWFRTIKKKIEYDNEINYKVVTDKVTFKMNYRGEEHPNWQPLFTIHPPTYQDWVDQPKYRLSDDPKPEHRVLLVDDYISQGRTIMQTQLALVELGYQKEDIFSYAHTMDITDRYQAYDSEFREMTLLQLLEALKQ